jgi:hypothetical protein
MKHWRTIAFLGVILVCLGGIATWDEWKTKKDKETEKTKNRLTMLKPEDIVELEYRNLGATQKNASISEGSGDEINENQAALMLTAVKRESIWHISSPTTYPADQTSIDSLLKTVTDYAFTQEIQANRSKWADYGLENPARTITLRASGDTKEQPFTIYVGSKAPIGYNVYFRTSASDKIYMGSQHLLISTAKSLFDFQDKKIMKIEENLLTSLMYERQGQPPISIEKSGDGYSIKLPETAEADIAEIKDFVGELNSIKAISIDDHPSSPLVIAFSKPEISISWQSGQEPGKKFLVTSHGGRWYGSFEPNSLIFGLPEDQHTKLRKELISFRNRRVLSTDILNVKSIEIDGFSYQNVAGNWYKPSDAVSVEATQATPEKGKSAPQEESHIRALMVDLEFAKTDRFLTSGSQETQRALQDAPQHRLRLAYEDPKSPPLTIELFPSDDAERYFVRRSDRPVVYRVAKSAFYNMQPRKEAPMKSRPSDSLPEDLPLDDSNDAPMNLSAPDANPAG